MAPIDRAHAAPVSDHACLAQAEADDARELERVESYDAVMRRAHVRPRHDDDISGIVLICMAVLLLCFAAFILLLPIEAGALGWREL